MYYDDLAIYKDELDRAYPGVLSVGWLFPTHEFKAGTVTPMLVNALRDIICVQTDTFDAHVNVVRSVRTCPFCRSRIQISCGKGCDELLGISEIWIPRSDGWFAAPSMVIHYIDYHHYVPPQEFIEAALAFSTKSHFLGQKVFDELACSWRPEGGMADTFGAK
jgi:hypothetical protein